MVGWKLKVSIVTVVAVVLPVIFHRHSKCDMTAVLNQIVSLKKKKKIKL